MERSHLTDFFKNFILRVRWRDMWFHPSCLKAGESPLSEDQLGLGLEKEKRVECGALAWRTKHNTGRPFY